MSISECANAAVPWCVSRTQRLTLILGLNLGLVAGLVAVGLTAHSLAVLAEGGDYLLDAAGAAVAVLAIRVSARGAGRNGRAGRPSATDLAALVNCGWLLLLEVLVAAAAAGRLATRTPEVHGLPVLVMSGVAALAMTIGALVLRADADADADDDADDDDETGGRDLSVAAVLLDTIADAAAAAGVAATGAIILAAGGWYWLDPAVALVIAVVVGYHAAILLRKVLRRLRLPGRLLMVVAVRRRAGVHGGVEVAAGDAGDDQCRQQEGGDQPSSHDVAHWVCPFSPPPRVRAAAGTCRRARDRLPESVSRPI
jgi:cobalt-zinc-cadmium efflux system protein